MDGREAHGRSCVVDGAEWSKLAARLNAAGGIRYTTKVSAPARPVNGGVVKIAGSCGANSRIWRVRTRRLIRNSGKASERGGDEHLPRQPMFGHQLASGATV